MASHSVLIIGCGSIGERHLRCFRNTGRVQVTACDANPALLKGIVDTYQVPGATSWEEALATHTFDAVVICTPAHLHVPIALKVLQRGCHLLIEKPLSQSLVGVDELVALAARAGTQVAVAYVLHVYPLLVTAREFLRARAFGPMRHVTLTSGQYFPGLRPAHAAHYSQTYYRDRKTGGGAIQDALTHSVNWVESVIGPTDSVLCDCAHQVLPDVTVEDTVNVSTRNGDVLVNYALNQFQAPNESTLQFHGETGSVKIELHRRRWGTFRRGDPDWTWNETAALDRDGPFLAQANAFLDQIEGQPARLCTLAAAVQTLRFNLAALQSAETGARVHCGRVIA